MKSAKNPQQPRPDLRLEVEPDVQAVMNRYWTDCSGAYDDHQRRSDRVAADRRAWTQVWAGALGDPTLGDTALDVLDVGTGSGHVATVLADLGHRVTGIDLAPGMLERAAQHAAAMSAPPRFALGDAVAPAFGAASFDAVVNRFVMWTLREPKVALANWTRLLRPGGTLAVVDALHFPEGLRMGADAPFESAYAGAVRDALPLAEATSITETVHLIEGAGFVDVTATPLSTIRALDERYGVAPGHEVITQYLIRGTRP